MMRSLARSACGTMLALAAAKAAAVPITSYHTTVTDSGGNLVSGTVTASFDLYVRPWSAVFGVSGVAPSGPVVLHDQLDLGPGLDFVVHVPPAFAAAPWVSTFAFQPPPTPGLPAMNSILLTLQDHGSQVPPFGVADVGDWCAPFPGGFELDTDGLFVLGRRANCAFADKVANIEAFNGAAALIFNWAPNTDPSLLPAQPIALGGFTPSIPVVVLSGEVGAEIVDLMQTTINGDVWSGLFVYADFAARWDPDVVTPVPEPPMLALLAAGVVVAAIRRARAPAVARR